MGNAFELKTERTELADEIHDHVNRQVNALKSAYPDIGEVSVNVKEPDPSRKGYYARIRTSWKRSELVSSAVGPDASSVVSVASSNLARRAKRLAREERREMRRRTRSVAA